MIIKAHSFREGGYQTLSTSMNELTDRTKRIKEVIPQDNKALMNMFDERIDKKAAHVFLLNNRLLEVETQLH